MSFGAVKFHPSLALNLVTATLYDFYVSRKKFEHALEKHLVGSDVGSHACINLFSLDGWRIYTWGSDSTRPFGVVPRAMCDNCGSVAPWRRKHDPHDMSKSRVSLKCRVCNASGGTHVMPSGLQPIHVQAAQKWYFRDHPLKNGSISFR